MSKPIIVILLKATILVGLSAYIYFKLSTVAEKGIWSYIHTGVSKHSLHLLVPLLLVSANWGLEALKWQKAVRSVENISFKTAFLGVLSGLNIGVLLPQALGDYAGRIMHLDSENRADAISSVFLCHFSQFFITCVAGLAGAVLFYFNGFYVEYLKVVFVIALVFILSLIMIVVFYKKLIKVILNRFQTLKKYYHYLKSILEIELQLIFKVFFLAFLRYLCFLTQFVMILYIFEVKVGAILMASAVMLVFFLKSIVPSFNFLADLGVREFSALAIFSVFGSSVENTSIIAASLMVWFINLFAPSILGVFTLYTLKVFPRKYES